MDQTQALFETAAPVMLLSHDWLAAYVNLALTLIGFISAVLVAVKPFLRRIPRWVDPLIMLLDFLAANTTPVKNARQLQTAKASRLSLMCFVFLLAAVPGCHGRAGRVAQVVWPAAVTCAPGWDDIGATVQRILIQDDQAPVLSKPSRDELGKLAIAHGADLVACMIVKVVNQWGAAGYNAQPLLSAARARGEAFLRDEQISAVLGAEP